MINPFFQWRARIVVLAVLLIPVSLKAASVSLTVEGAEGEVLENIRARTELAAVSERSDLSPTYIDWLYQQLPEQARRAVEPYGYYHSTVTSDLQQSGQNYQVMLNIDLGEPTRVSAVSVVIEGEGKTDPAILSVVDAFPLARDDVLDHRRYEVGKTRIADALRDYGYFDARQTRAAIQLSPSLDSAEILLRWESGERHRFGPIRVRGGPVRESVVHAQATFKQGDAFAQDLLDRYYRRLVDSGYFSSVSVVPRLRRKEGLEVPIAVVLQERPRNLYEAGFIWSTDSGPGVEVGAERRWFSDRGDRIRGEVSASTRRKAATFRYHRPSTEAPVLGHDLTLSYLDEETDSRQSKIYELGLSQSRELIQIQDWRLVSGVAYRQEDFIAGEGEGDSELLVLSGDLAYIDVEGVYPRRGYTLRFTLRGGLEDVLSDTDFIQAEARAAKIIPVAELDRLIVRGHVGATGVDHITDLPPAYRFYAGGDRSIRGYDFEALGPLNENGEVIGGRFLAVASVEYEHRLFGPWGVAFFVDAGNAFDSGFNEVAYGTGIGLRWVSPIGPLRLDIATAPKEPGTPIRLHFGLGPSL